MQITSVTESLYLKSSNAYVIILTKNINNNIAIYGSGDFIKKPQAG